MFYIFISFATIELPDLALYLVFFSPVHLNRYFHHVLIIITWIRLSIMLVGYEHGWIADDSTMKQNS